MIVVKIELHSAITDEIKEIGRMVICNRGGTRTKGEYSVDQLLPGTKLKPGCLDNPVRHGEVKDHLRLRKPVWNLLYKALKAIGHDS